MAKGYKPPKYKGTRERKLTPAQVKRRAEVEQRRIQAVALRRRGASWPMIAKQLGYAGENRAQADVFRAYREQMAPDIDAMRQDALEKLEHWVAQAALPIGVAETDKDGKPIARTHDDKKLDLDRIETARKLMKDVRDLFGLDKPRQIGVSGSILHLTPEQIAAMPTADIVFVQKHGRLPNAPVRALPAEVLDAVLVEDEPDAG